MAKRDNVIIIGSDGNIAVGTSKGKVSLVSKGSKVAREIAQLAKQRQELGKKLTDALESAGVDVAGTSQSLVIYAAGEPTSSKKK